MTPTKLELVALHLLDAGLAASCSALSGLSVCHDLNFRNGVSDLRKVGITILDEYFRHHHTNGGEVYLKRYWLATDEDVRNLVVLVNSRRAKRGAMPLSPELVARYLSPSYEDVPAAAEG